MLKKIVICYLLLNYKRQQILKADEDINRFQTNCNFSDAPKLLVTSLSPKIITGFTVSVKWSKKLMYHKNTKLFDNIFLHLILKFIFIQIIFIVLKIDFFFYNSKYLIIDHLILFISNETIFKN